jgi:hypothetical protein
MHIYFRWTEAEGERLVPNPHGDLVVRPLLPAQIAAMLDCRPAMVRRWIIRFNIEGAPGAGRSAPVPVALAQRMPADQADYRAAGPPGPAGPYLGSDATWASRRSGCTPGTAGSGRLDRPGGRARPGVPRAKRRSTTNLGLRFT